MYNKAISRKMITTMILSIVLIVIIGVLIVYTVLWNVQSSGLNKIQLDEAHMNVFAEAGFVTAGNQEDGLIKEDEKISIMVFLNGTSDKSYPHVSIQIVGDGEEVIHEEIVYNAVDKTISYTVLQPEQLLTMELNATDLRVNRFDVTENEAPVVDEDEGEDGATDGSVDNQTGQADDGEQTSDDTEGVDGSLEGGVVEEEAPMTKAEKSEWMQLRLKQVMGSFYATFGFSVENMLGQETPDYMDGIENKVSFGYLVTESICAPGEKEGEFTYASADGNRDIALHLFADPQDASDMAYLTISNKSTNITSTIDAMKTLRCTYYEGTIQFYVAYDYTTSALLLIRQNGSDITNSYPETSVLREKMRTTYQSEEEYVQSIFGFSSDMLLRSSDPIDFEALQAEIDAQNQQNEGGDDNDGGLDENGEGDEDGGAQDDGGEGVPQE